MKRILFLLLISASAQAQIRPQVNLVYNVGYEVVGTDVLGLVNDYHDMIHPNMEEPFLKMLKTPLFYGPQVEAGVHFDGHFSALLVYGQNRGVYSETVGARIGGPDYSLTRLYTRHTNHMHFGGRFGYRFTPEKMNSFFVNVGALYIQRYDEIFTEYHEVYVDLIDNRKLTAHVVQRAWAVPVEAGQEYNIIEGLSAGWFINYTWFSTRFIRSEIQEYKMNDENLTQDLSQRQRLWEFNGQADNPDNEDASRNLSKRRENLMRLSLGVRVSYRF